MEIKTKLKENILKIELPLREEPKVSASGKSIVIASTRGPKNTGVEYQGQDIYLVTNAFVRNPKYDSTKTAQSPKKSTVSGGPRTRGYRKA